MIDFTNTIRIERPVEDVFSYLSDLEHIPEWNWAVVETRKVTPGPIAVGSVYRQTRTVPQPAIETLEITQFDPSERIEVRGVLAQMPALLSYVLNEDGTGTELINTVNLDPKGPFRLVAPVLNRRIKQAVGKNLLDLKTQLEAEHNRQSERSN